jgi:hypothetical protein
MGEPLLIGVVRGFHPLGKEDWAEQTPGDNGDCGKNEQADDNFMNAFHIVL